MVLFLSTCIVFYAPIAIADPSNGMHALADKVARAHRAGQAFWEAVLFAPANAPAHIGILDEETILQTLTAPTHELYNSAPSAVSITLKTASGKEYTLEMLRAFPTGTQPKIGTIDASGRHASSFTPGLHYQGSLKGQEHSTASMSVFASGEIMMLFSNEQGNFVLGKLADASGNYILYNDRDLHGRSSAPCGVVDPLPGIKPEGGPAAKTAGAMLCNKVRVYWEVAYKLFTNKGSSLSNAQNYALGLFNEFQAVYANENIAMELSGLYVWTAPDDYPITGSSAALTAFRRYWNSLNDEFDADLAHLLHRTTTSPSGGGLGGVAYVDALCISRNFAYAFSDLYGFYNTIPTYSWDVEVISHETGHNLGSKHTHWCGWMTGPGGTCGSIDNCYTQESAPCGSCTFETFDNASATTWKGTIMSYCHLVSRGINLSNGFGPLPGAVIRSNVGSRSCLKPTINANLIPVGICNGTGSISLQFPQNHFGTAPYKFTWTGGATSQNLNNITSPGTYTVTVTDSNNCSQLFSADVSVMPSSGNAQALTTQLPVCCNAFNAPLVLQATVPQGLNSCYSVYWLRSSSPFASPVDARTYFDTTQIANVLKSTNESSIANDTTGASLSVEPAPCTSSTTWYYTPVVVRLPASADSIIQTSSTNTNQIVSSVKVGSSVSLSSQVGATKLCYELDTPSVSEIDVTISSYTGRPDKLRIVIQDATGLVVYQSPPLSGNGTYTITAPEVEGDLLQARKIIALDYNCRDSSGSRVCTTSNLNVSASRKVVFAAHPARMDIACTHGTPVRVDFAPDACTKLSVTSLSKSSLLSLHPNPASSSVSLRFTLPSTSRLIWKLTDMTGRIISANESTYSKGTHETTLNTAEWARGIYIIQLSGSEGHKEQVKLVLE
jgi:hypothetical protein